MQCQKFKRNAHVINNLCINYGVPIKAEKRSCVVCNCQPLKSIIQAKHIRIPTIYEIYPPSIDEESSHYSSFIDGESLLQTVHRSHITKTPENSDGENTAIGLSGSTNQPLVPLPRNVLPSHYDIQVMFDTQG